MILASASGLLGIGAKKMKMELEIVDHCVLCGGRDLKPIAMTLRYGQPHFVRVRCRNCKLVISSPMATANCLSDYYEDYFSTGPHSNVTTGDDFEQRVNSAKKTIKEIVDSGIMKETFLDVGCGSGHVCAAARDLGFKKVYGVDLSSSGVGFGRSNFGLENLTCGELADCDYANDYFDVVHCWHLIEHVRDPVALLKEVSRILKPSGILYWGTDNHRSFGYFMLRLLCHLTLRFPPIYDGIEHTYGFDPSTIKRALQETGFKVRFTKSYADRFSAKEVLRDLRASGVIKAFRTIMQSVFRIKMKGVAQKKALNLDFSLEGGA